MLFVIPDREKQFSCLEIRFLYFRSKSMRKVHSHKSGPMSMLRNTCSSDSSFILFVYIVLEIVFA